MGAGLHITKNIRLFILGRTGQKPRNFDTMNREKIVAMDIGASADVSENESMSRPSDFSFRRWPFYWVARLGGVYFSRMEAALKPIGLDLPKWRVLSTLFEKERLSVSEIADHAISKLSTMTKIIQRMQADGLVTCEPCATDGRVTQVIITDKGREAGQQAWDIADRIFREAFKGVSATQQRQLVQTLQAITENMS